MGPQSYQLLQRNVPVCRWGGGLHLSPDIRLIVKIDKFWVPYFHEFATDSHETLHIILLNLT